GPSDAAGVAVRDSLPAGVEFLSASNGGSATGSIVTWPVTSLASGASLSYMVSVTAPGTGTLVNVAVADAPTDDPDAANNDGSAAASRVNTTVIESADLEVTKTGPAGAAALGAISYTVTVTNHGPSDASAVVARDTLPAGVAFVSASDGGTFAS